MSQSERPGRQNPFTFMLAETFDQMMRQMMFCLPGKVTAFDPETQLAQVECGIQRMVEGKGRTIPVISSVPVHFAGSGEWYMFHKVEAGTEGLIHFSQRAVDTWIDQGGPVEPHERRMLSEEDAFFVPGFRSKPGVIPDFNNDGVGLSNYAGDTVIHLDDAKNITMKSPGNISIDAGGDVLVSGSLFKWTAK